MKLSNILITALFIFVTSCSQQKADHGHSHGADGHTHDEGNSDHLHEDDHPHEQEEFTVSSDSVKNDSSHTNGDGSTHHNH